MATNAPTKATMGPTMATKGPTSDPTRSPSEAPTIDLERYLARFNPTATTTPSPVIGEESDEGESGEGKGMGEDFYREATASPTSAPTNGGGRRRGMGVMGCLVVMVMMSGMV